MIKIINQPESYLKGLVLARSPGLYIKRKGDRLLVLNPGLGLYTIFSPQFSGFFNRLKKSMHYNDFICNDQGIPPAIYAAFIEESYQKGIVTIAGKGVEAANTKNKCSVTYPPVFNAVFTGGGRGTGFFAPLLEEKIEACPEGDFYVNLKGGVDFTASGFMDFLQKMVEKGLAKGARVRFSIDGDPEAKEDAYRAELASLKAEINFYLDLAGKDQDDAAIKRVLDRAERLKKKDIFVTTTLFFREPHTMTPVVERLLQAGIDRIGIKISNDVVLADTPPTGHIRTMEKFAVESLNVVDLIFKNYSLTKQAAVLNDIQRFSARLLGFGSSHPCGSRPCGMGTQVQVCRDDETRYLCNPVGPRSEEILRINSDSDTIIKSLRAGIESFSSRCMQCPWRLFCGGGCPAVTFEKYGTFDREDPRCRYFHVVFEELIWKLYEHPSLAAGIGGLY